MAVFEGYVGDAAGTLVLAVILVALLTVTWAVLATLDAARRTKPTMNWKRGMSLGMFANKRTPTRGMTPWASVMLVAGTGAAVLLFVIYLLNEAVNVI